MADRKTTSRTKRPVSTSKTSTASTRVSKPTKKTEDQSDFPSDFDDLSAEKKPRTFPKKAGYLIAVILGVGLLLFFGSRYLVVAWVDQKPITRFEYYKALDQRFGKDLKEELIVQKLLENEADRKNIAISPQELQTEITKIEEQQGGADKLNQILQAQNISRDEFNKLIKLQLVRTKLFSEGAEASEEAVRQYIEENKDALPIGQDAQGNSQDPGQDENLKNSIKDQLKQQKINQNFSTWLQENLQGSRVMRN